jgi:VWFA-related protein
MLLKADDADRGSKMDALKRAATRFVDLMRTNAKTTVLSFSDRVDAPEPFSNDKAALKDRVRRLKAWGGTSLYDATFAGVETLMAESPAGRKAVVVLTDGRDEAPGSRRSDDAVIERAKEVKVPLYMLGLGRPEEINEPVMRKMAKETGGDYYHAGTERKLLELFEDLSIRLHDDGIDEPSLSKLAEGTGGRHTSLRNVSDLQPLYERLAEELQSTYEVTFKSRRTSHDGTARTISVKVVRGGEVISEGGEASVVARGIVVPQMDYAVYLAFFAALAALFVLPVGLRRGGARSAG